MVPKLLMFISLIGCFKAASQTFVSGTIYDDTGEALIGATIQVKGTTEGTVSDYEGKFILQAQPEDVLVISFIGFVTQEIRVGQQAQITVTMLSDIEALEEIVVVGYGTQRKRDVTGAVASLKPKDIQSLPVSRTDRALQGRIAGVNIQNDNAAPNSETRIRIRGSNSLLGNNNPLIVIDGFQDGRLNMVHADDIASIEVLKDASSLAIYGSKGANGAVLITTKSGTKKEKGLKFTYSNYFARHEIRNKLDILNAAQYAKRQNQDAAELGGIQPFTEAEITSFAANGGTDWQDEIFTEAWAINHHISLNGSGERINYFLSGDFLDQDGIVLGSEFRRYAIRANMGYELTEKLKLDLNSHISKTEDSPVTLNTFSGENSGSPINSALLWSPTDPVFTDKANREYTLPGYDTDVGPLTDYNPVALAAEPIRDFNQLSSLINANLSYKLLEGLSVNIRGAIRLIDEENNEFINNRPTQIENSETASIQNSRNVFTQTSYLINYTNEFGGAHSLNFTGLYEEQFGEFNSSWMGARGFISDAVSYNNLGLGQDQFPLSSDRTRRSLRSYMTRINYVFRGKYLFTFTSRWDGSSVFGENNKWAFFPSGALGWNVGNEPFIQDNLDFISLFKIRVSYGLTGSQAIPPGGSIGLIGDDFTYPLDGNIVSPGIGLADRASNPNLKWETTEQFNAGVDMELLAGRFNVTADYYVKKTRDLLFERPVPEATGSSTQFVNVGAMQNKGIELYIEGTPVDKEVNWTTGLTFARNRNEVLELIDGNEELPIGSVGFPGFDNFIWVQVGQPIGQFRGAQFAGIWQAGEAGEAALYGAIPGSPKGVDVNGDTVINQDDVVILGNSQPDFAYGWNNNIRYRNFDLNVFIQGVRGIRKLNLSQLQLLRGTGKDLLDRWTPTNTNTDVPSRIGEATYGIPNSDRYIEDASYLRVKNISLGYSFPEELLSGLGLETARIYISAYNVFTITDYTGYDPESTNSDKDFNSGVDLATFPEQKIYTIGLNVTF